jgi:predicted RNA-binding protein with PIN domain
MPVEDADDTVVAEREPLIDLDDERRRLLDDIASFMGRTSDQAIVVFDSREEALERSESATAQVDVYFGSFSRSADSIIEREVYALSPGESVIVVSSDYQLQKTIFLPNVVRLSSRQFASELHKDKKRIANYTDRITMSLRVEERVPSDTLEQLSRLRDGLQEDDR